MAEKKTVPAENQQAAPAAPVKDAGGLRAEIEKLLLEKEDISIIRLVDALVQYANLARASDIHIDPDAKRLRVRFRIDGVMHDEFEFLKDIQSEVITRIKVVSGLRTDEHQAAQDGRFRMQVEGMGDIDVRVSIAPTYYGENCVMRVLAGQSESFAVETLGLSQSNLKKVLQAIGRPYGMILVTGPTGSGKTTTLYSILRRLNTPEVSIITIEGPIEYSIAGIDQIPVHKDTNLTFAAGLRFILRQDPDVIMVGEIRDEETANIAVNAAMTGHLLLSTLHTNDAATTLPRLLDMKIEPFLIASTMNIAINQRLVRKICPDCRKEKKIGDLELSNIKEIVSEEILQGRQSFYVGEGCDLCGGSGYRGRIGIHEVLEVSEEIRKLIMQRADADQIKQASVRGGMRTILEDGFEKALQGITTIEEVLRVSRE
ncbi:type II secretion system protein GspE [bacterium]|nr:type II secretion system protein GspE [bacterium]